jgi:hypothetical protein
MVVYLRITYLQSVHYYYFGLSILSFFTAFLLGFMPSFFMIFIILFGLNSVVSWLMSIHIYRKVRQLIVINSARYIIKHLLLAMAIIGGEMSVVFFTSGYLTLMLNAFMLLNFFTLFAVAMLYGISRIRFVSREFATQDVFRMRVAKNMMIQFRHRERMRPVFVTDQEIREYELGTINGLDRILTSIAKERGGGNMKIRVREFEKDFLESYLRIAQKTADLMKKGADTPGSGKAREELIKKEESYRSRLRMFKEHEFMKSQEKVRFV